MVAYFTFLLVLMTIGWETQFCSAKKKDPVIHLGPGGCYIKYESGEGRNGCGRKKREVAAAQNEIPGRFQSMSKIRTEICHEKMVKAGIDMENFPFGTAHRIHSLTVQDLRYYFDRTASALNGIPTINANLLAETLVLANAPDVPSKFVSPSMRHLDALLTHMTNAHYAVAKGTVKDEHLPLILNRIIHSAHMEDMWSQMKPVFDDLVKNPPKDKTLCPCVKDDRNNGVYQMLQNMSQGKGTALIGDPDAEFDEIVTYNSTAIQDFWINNMKKELLGFYDKDSKDDIFGAALFVYCKLKE